MIRSTVADVDLDAIVANLKPVAPHGERVIAVVKADAYGHGAEVVGRALQDAGVEMLAVFTVDEGIELRASGITAPILVLGGITTESEAPSVVDHDLTAVVWDEERTRVLSDAARARKRSAKVHFKVDTGLTRLGAPLDRAVDQYARVRALPGAHLDGVFTHFANADVPGDTFTTEQLRLFAGFVSALPWRPRLIHAAASAGVGLLDTSATCNAVRPGAALYGLYPAPHLLAGLLRPALRWSSTLHRVAKVPKGTGVSYGHDYRLPRDGVIATVPIGYGDGLPRHAAASTHVLVRGCSAPIAGRIAMDLVMLDVTDVPGAREGDEAVLIGEQGGKRVSAEDLAAAWGTINYEVTTNIRRRVSRRYTRGGAEVAERTLAGVNWR
jgi:alanine racemase